MYIQLVQITLGYYIDLLIEAINFGSKDGLYDCSFQAASASNLIVALTSILLFSDTNRIYTYVHGFTRKGGSYFFLQVM